MSDPSKKSGSPGWSFLLWILVGYFFLGFPAAFLVGLGWLPLDETLTTFAPVIWAMEQAGPIGEAWGGAIRKCHDFGETLKRR